MEKKYYPDCLALCTTINSVAYEVIIHDHLKYTNLSMNHELVLLHFVF